MPLSFALIRHRRLRPFQRHIEIAENVVSQILKAMCRMGWVVVVCPTIENQLVIAVHAVVQLWQID